MTQRFFYGWVVLAAAFVIITMSIGTLHGGGRHPTGRRDTQRKPGAVSPSSVAFRNNPLDRLSLAV